MKRGIPAISLAASVSSLCNAQAMQSVPINLNLSPYYAVTLTGSSPNGLTLRSTDSSSYLGPNNTDMASGVATYSAYANTGYHLVISLPISRGPGGTWVWSFANSGGMPTGPTNSQPGSTVTISNVGLLPIYSQFATIHGSNPTANSGDTGMIPVYLAGIGLSDGVNPNMGGAAIVATISN